MALTSGANLGPYEIKCLLGGGMGEVYSRDIRLEHQGDVVPVSRRNRAGTSHSKRRQRFATYHLAAALMLSAVMASGQQTPVPVDEEPHHHVLFKNEFVIVIRATLQPGEISLYHTHSHDSADIEIVSSTTREQVLGNEEASPETSHAGDVSADSCDAPITHRVRNVGSRPMDIIHVEFLQRPTHPSSQAAAGLATENASARVYNWIIAPRANTPRHSHNRPYLIVAATPMRLKMTAADGQSRSEEVNTGDFHWIESRVGHTLENDGVAQGQIVEMELK